MAPAVDDVAAVDSAAEAKKSKLEQWRANRNDSAKRLAEFQNAAATVAAHLSRPAPVRPAKLKAKVKRSSDAHPNLSSQPDNLPKRITRSSTRLSYGDDSVDRKRELDALHSEVAAPIAAKKARNNSDLSLNDITVSGRSFSDGFGGLSGLSFRGAEPGVKTFDASAETTDKDVAKARKLLQGLQLYDKWAVNGM